MNRQEIYTRVKAHLLTQNAKARLPDDRGCAYRDSLGRKCAIGCLILDEHYTPFLEGAGVRSDQVQAALAKSGIKFNANSVDEAFLQQLQGIHDNDSVVDWPRLLTRFAKQYNLKE